MREANLISILSARKNLSPELFAAYLSYHSIQIKPAELNDLEVLVSHLKTENPRISLFDKYFIGYAIPQIAKEFDLLRIDHESVVNIELKSTSTQEKIRTQLIRNKYYLSFLKRRTFNYTYVSESRKLYTIDQDGNLVETSITEILGVLDSQRVKTITDIDSYFNPTNYLVSPFNSTQEFIDGKYFLTLHQEEIKKTALEQLSTSAYSIISIKGRAGTGKTLLTYDIAREVLQQKKTLIVHCGILNAGHLTLRDKCGWNIIPAKFLANEDLSKYYLIVIDEAQRIYPHQLAHVISEVKKYSNNCIFSYDGVQTLRRGEIHENIAEKIEKEVTTKPSELTAKIRTNKEAASFIQCLFDKNKGLEKYHYSNIEVRFFENYQEAKTYLKYLKTEEWKVINYTPSRILTLPYELHNLDEESDNAHTVIGQEFNNVVAVIDEHFFYRDGRLSTQKYQKRPYYHPAKMLLQIVSRTRLKLCVVIINNPEILSRCLSILRQ